MVFGEDSTEEVGPERSFKVLAVRRQLGRASEDTGRVRKGHRQGCADVLWRPIISMLM